MSTPYTSTQRREERPRVAALVTLFLVSAFIFANMYTTQAILPVLGEDFHVSAPTAGLTVSVLVLAVTMYLSLYYFGGSLGAVLPGLLLERTGWPGVALLCVGMTLVSLTADALLCR